MWRNESAERFPWRSTSLISTFKVWQMFPEEPPPPALLSPPCPAGCPPARRPPRGCPRPPGRPPGRPAGWPRSGCCCTWRSRCWPCSRSGSSSRRGPARAACASAAAPSPWWPCSGPCRAACGCTPAAAASSSSPSSRWAGGCSSSRRSPPWWRSARPGAAPASCASFAPGREDKTGQEALRRGRRHVRRSYSPAGRWCAGGSPASGTGSGRRSPAACTPSLCGDGWSRTAASAAKQNLELFIWGAGSSH